MPDPLNWINDEWKRLSQAGLVRQWRVVTSLADGCCLVDGRKLRNFAGNDYLNLAHDRRVVAAAQRAFSEAGSGAGASALVCGRSPWHAALEERLARFEGQPSALLFPTGYAANVGTIVALVGEGDTVYCDRFNHASLVDGCRLSGARLRVYRHQRLEVLERELKQPLGAGRRLIVTDGVFSMDGELAPLAALCDLAERYQAMLLVDEAHGTGVFGANGRGAAEWLGVEERVTIRVGTLSKAVGALGGFVTGSQALIGWLWNKARTQVYSTALPPAVCAAAIAALEIIEAEPQRREHLLHRSSQLRAKLTARGVDPLPQSVGPIVPVVVQTPQRAVQCAAELEECGYLVGTIRPPTVPEGTSRLRISVSSIPGIDDLGEFAKQVAEVISK